MRSIKEMALLKREVEASITAVRDSLGSERFLNGQCHLLASVLREKFGGDLIAIMRHEVDLDGDRFSSTFSHMVLEVDNECYDVDGGFADLRWEELWPSEPDCDGLLNEFEYLTLQPDELGPFLTQWKGHPPSPELEVQLRELLFAEADCKATLSLP